MHEKSSKCTVISNPFPGLRAFKDFENHLFFGSEDDFVDRIAPRNTFYLGYFGGSGLALIKM